MGQRATDTSAFALTDVVVPAENRLGEEGQGFKIAMQTLDFTRPGTAAGASRGRPGGVQVRRRLCEAARHFRRADRDAPGRQLHDRRYGDRDRGCGLLVWQARGCTTGQARHARVVVREASADTAMKVTTDAVQVFRRLRLHEGVPRREADDAGLFQIYEGTLARSSGS